MLQIVALTLLAAALLAGPTTALSIELVKSNVGLEVYYYPKSVDTGQDHGQAAFVAGLEVEETFDNGWFARMSPIVRSDPTQQSRNKIDLQEGFAEYSRGQWSSRLGLLKLSWSVTESVNIIPHQIVDIINQRDLAGNPDGSEKLGAAAMSVAYQNDETLVEAFVLPWLRAREFPATDSREHPFRGQFDLNTDPTYASHNEEYRPSFAVRIEHVVEQANLAGIFYTGYSPTPTVVPSRNGKALVHYYLQDMFGFSQQSTVGKWITKSELAYVHTRDDSIGLVPDDYFAAVNGIEYTFIRPETNYDLSVIAEWLYDSRGDGPLGSQLQNDLFAGMRWVANDLDDTSILGGTVLDVQDGAAILHLEYTRRLAEQWQLQAVLRNYFSPEQNALVAFEDDNLFQVNLRRFF